MRTFDSHNDFSLLYDDIALSGALAGLFQHPAMHLHNLVHGQEVLD